MRIVSGALKGRNLVAPPGQGTRPTSDRARQAVFNILEHAAWAPPLAGARVIDLFAGSGALGFEALSRGAAFCLFVETEAAARGAIRDNAEAFALFGRTRIHRLHRLLQPLDRRPARSTGVERALSATDNDGIFPNADPPLSSARKASTCCTASPRNVGAGTVAAWRLGPEAHLGQSGSMGSWWSLTQLGRSPL
jgi:16S rRNA (guanine(966)-N(2))-methyltransferase RsmD